MYALHHQTIYEKRVAKQTMRLQQLEIAGFKSFSDRSHLSFDRGETGREIGLRRRANSIGREREHAEILLS